jgi:hypothetical protein
VSLFKKSPPSAARQLLFDPVFACTAPGVTELRVDYDPAVWVRMPALGQDRTIWVEQVQAAYADDLGWGPGSPEHAKIDAAANEIADTGLSYTANFITFPSGPTDFALAHVHVLDEELTLLEYGDPEAYLTFADVDPGRPRKVQTFPQGWRYGMAGFVDPVSGPGSHVRGHKRLDLDPVLHVVGIGLSRGKGIAGDVMSVFARSHVALTDGRVL